MRSPEPAFARYEIKLACAAEYLPEVRCWVRGHPALFSETYEPRRVNNIYLDTLAGDDLGAHLSGIGRRQKLRFRWYGEAPSAVRGSLELKCRAGHLGWKQTYEIPRSFDLCHISWHEWMAQVRALAEGPAMTWLASVERPTLINGYRREYFEASEGQIRLTIDHPVSVYDQIAYASPNLLFAVPTLREISVEVKASLAEWRRLPEVLARFPLRAVRHSKYVSGMQSILAL
jgi:hypothetical protein